MSEQLAPIAGEILPHHEQQDHDAGMAQRQFLELARSVPEHLRAELMVEWRRIAAEHRRAGFRVVAK